MERARAEWPQFLQRRPSQEEEGAEAGPRQGDRGGDEPMIRNEKLTRSKCCFHPSSMSELIILDEEIGAGKAVRIGIMQCVVSLSVRKPIVRTFSATLRSAVSFSPPDSRWPSGHNTVTSASARCIVSPAMSSPLSADGLIIYGVLSSVHSVFLTPITGARRSASQTSCLGPQRTNKLS